MAGKMPAPRGVRGILSGAFSHPEKQKMRISGFLGCQAGPIEL